MFRLLENISECILVANQNNQIEYVNKSLAKTFGFHPHELLNKSLDILIPEASSGKHAQHIRNYFKNPSNRKMGKGKYLQGRKKNGEVFPIEVSLNYTKFNNQHVALAIVVDVSEQKEILDQLSLSQSLYSSLVENAADHIFQIDRDLKIQYINHVRPGLSKDKVLNSNLLDIIPNEASRQLVKTTVSRVFEKGHSEEYNIEFPTPSGIMHYSTIVSPVIKHGKVIGANLISRDLTELINLKDELLNKQLFIDKISSYGLNGIYIYNLKTCKNTYMNQSYKSILGYTIDDINNMQPTDFFALFHPEDQKTISEHMNTVANLPVGKTSNIQYRFKSKKGKWVWCKSVDSGFEYDDDGKMISFIGSFIDITQQKENELSLIKKNNEIEQFAHIVSHDIRAPLNNVISGLQVLSMDGLANNEEHKKLIGSIIESTHRMKDMVSALLLNAKVDQENEWTEFNSNNVIENIKTDLSEMISETQAEIIQQDLPVIYGVKPLFYLLLQNLIINSIKFKHQERLPKITITSQERLQHWLFIYEDNGLGIPKNDIENMFNMLARSSKHRKIEGAGIGLSTCQKIVNLHNGEIWVESEEEKGTIFYFTILKST